VGIGIIVLIVVLVLLFLFLGFIWMTYNGLVRLRNQVKNAWAQIDVQLKRRHDLIPNLMETVKGYMKHERETLEAVTNARNLAQKAVGTGVGSQAKAEGELSGALSRLLAVVENYPDLKAKEELTSTENKISFSRQYYNDSVLTYNNKTQMVPSNIIAGMFGFKHGEFFEVTVAAEREAPKVSFS